MDPDRSLTASFWFTIFLQTLGSVDMPGSGPRKMPSPRSFLAAIIVWGGLDLFADAGYERGAVTAGWIMTLTSAVVGPFGAQLVKLLNSAADQLAPSQPPATGVSQ